MLEEQAAIQKKLGEAFAQLQSKNPSYSMRALARRVGLAPSTISEVLKGKRAVSKNLAKQIMTRLCFDPSETEEVIRLFQKDKDIDGFNDVEAKTAPRPTIEFDLDQFKLVADWYHFAIYILAETDEFNDDPIWIGQRLNLSVKVVQGALERLERLGMLIRSPEGKLKTSGKQFFASDNIAEVALRKLHYKNLELAQRSLDNDDPEDRDFRSAFISFDPQRMDELKEYVMNFLSVLCEKFETGSRKEVHQMCVQFFPLTRPVAKGSKT